MNLFSVSEDGVESAISDLDRDTEGSPWHVRFSLTEEEIPTISAITGKITIGGEEFSHSDSDWYSDHPDVSDELLNWRNEFGAAAQEADDKADVL